MRKLKIMVALLVLLFVCHAVFAAYMPVDKADKADVDQFAFCYDILRNLEFSNEDPVEMLLALANLDDETLKTFAVYYGDGKGTENITSVEELAAIFPRVIEGTDLINAFRRTAFHLAVYRAYNGIVRDTVVVDSAEARYELVGYDFIFRLEGNKFIFKFLDVVSDAELAQIGARIGMVVPGTQTWENTKPGEIVINLASGLTQTEFDSAVRLAESQIHSTIY